jgi:hypothetical protein
VTPSPDAFFKSPSSHIVLYGGTVYVSLTFDDVRELQRLAREYFEVDDELGKLPCGFVKEVAERCRELSERKKRVLDGLLEYGGRLGLPVYFFELTEPDYPALIFDRGEIRIYVNPDLTIVFEGETIEIIGD